MHNGEIVELIVRKNKMSISELSRKLKVSRKSVYNWFRKEDLSIEVINRVGQILNHSFVNELPEKYEAYQKQSRKAKSLRHEIENTDDDLAFYWKNKYINLLETYTNLLIKGRK